MYEQIKKILDQGRSAVLATVIRQTGASPRGLGAQCLIVDDGSLVGTIGGGLVEARTLEEAQTVMGGDSAARFHFSMTGKEVADTDMLCGGQVDIFLEPVSPRNRTSVTIYEEAAAAVAEGTPGIMATVIDPSHWDSSTLPKVFIGRHGRVAGELPRLPGVVDTLSDQMDHLLAKRTPLIAVMEDSGVEVFVEPVASDPVLFIFGAGHVSREIVPLAARVGFQVVVVDDREEFADARQIPDAKEVCLQPFDGVMVNLPVDDMSYLVIVTRGHLHDKVVLAQSLRTRAAYIGMIGSRRKRDIVYQQLLAEGFTQDDISRVHSPIGLDIGAETPAEIAVSIVAELIKVRSGKAESSTSDSRNEGQGTQ